MNKEIKTRFLCLVSIYLFFSINISAQITDWFFVALTNEKNAIFIDRDFVLKPEGLTRVWQKSVSSNKSYSVSLGEWNCSNKSFRVVQSIMYDGANNIIGRGSRPSNWKYITPDSTGMFLYLNICDEQLGVSSNKSTNTYNNSNSLFAQITAKNTKLMSKPNMKSRIIRTVRAGETITLISATPVKGWFQFLDTRTKTRGWLHRSTFTVINPAQ